MVKTTTQIKGDGTYYLQIYTRNTEISKKTGKRIWGKWRKFRGVNGLRSPQSDLNNDYSITNVDSINYTNSVYGTTKKNAEFMRYKFNKGFYPGTISEMAKDGWYKAVVVNLNRYKIPGKR